MDSLDQLLTTYHDEGFVILPDVLDAEQVNATRAALAPYLDLELSGRNNFEGERTQRVYSLVGRGREFEHSAEHPLVLEILDRLLQPGYLLTASQAICIHPGETPQPLHSDDPFYTLPRPRPAISVSTIWALDDFTEIGGGTQVLRGSHTWSDDEIGALQRPASGVPFAREIEEEKERELAKRLTSIEMSAGSLAVFAGTLLHRGGGNDSTGTRRAFSHQYCEPWGRQQENFVLSVPKERAKSMSPRLRALLGYSIHPPFMGQVAGRHPEKSLADGYVNSLIADDAAIAKNRE